MYQYDPGKINILKDIMIPVLTTLLCDCLTGVIENWFLFSKEGSISEFSITDITYIIHIAF